MIFYLTFGQAHHHTIGPATITPDDVVEIPASDYATARDFAFETFGAKWSMLYETEPDHSMFPGQFLDIHDLRAQASAQPKTMTLWVSFYYYNSGTANKPGELSVMTTSIRHELGPSETSPEVNFVASFPLDIPVPDNIIDPLTAALQSADALIAQKQAETGSTLAQLQQYKRTIQAIEYQPHADHKPEIEINPDLNDDILS